VLLELWRFSSQQDSTLGCLLHKDQPGDDPRFLCFTLEDEYRTVKIYGETRIPNGDYLLGLRKEGSFDARYAARFPQFHEGMLQILNVPNFEYVLIHCGNRDDDTAGCILVGDSSQQNVTEEGFIGGSSAAYSRIYPLIASAIVNGEEVWLRIVDLS